MVDPDKTEPEGLDEGAVANALVKVVAIAVVIGLVVGGGIFLALRSAGVGDSAGAAVEDLPDGSSATRSPLPTTALTPPGQEPSSSSTPTPSESPSESETPEGKLTLSAGQSQVAPGERIDLTGQYAGQDGVVLQVQRRSGGSWGAFADVTARVSGGSFSTYVITSQGGKQRFRVFDQSADQGSNPVVVNVG